MDNSPKVIKTILNILFAFIIAKLLIGCANRATATLSQDVDLSKIKSIYVTKFPPDNRYINLLIADNLREKGYVVSTGEGKIEGVDAIITYRDKWQWDITMYMIELTITVRDPKTDFPLATGNSYHTSLTRKSPEAMVGEVLTNIFKQKQ